jgi:hypothetical protein
MHLDDVGLLMRLVDAWELRKANSAIGFWINKFISWEIINNDVGLIGIPFVGG